MYEYADDVRYTETGCKINMVKQEYQFGQKEDAEPVNVIQQKEFYP
jgi:hypothetical protein